jgi:hypothetical protein
MPSLGKKTIIRQNKSLKLEREKDPSYSLNNYYFSDDRDESNRQLKNLKRRMCKFNAQQLRSDMEARKKKTFLN